MGGSSAGSLASVALTEGLWWFACWSAWSSSEAINCQLGDIYYECLEPGEVLGRTDVPRYRGDGFDEESTEDVF